MSGQGRWLLFPDAARELGVSDRSIRRYAEQGRYRVRWERGQRQIYLSADGAPPDTDCVLEDSPPAADNLPLADTDRSPPPAADGKGNSLSEDGPAMAILADLLREERELLREERDARSQAEQAAAMWQERASNLEAALERVLALPAHEVEPLRRRWWPFRRQLRETG